jgi:hypothetical protein
MAPKKKPLPLRRSRQLIEDERVNVARRTRERIALLFPSPEYSVDKATQTEIPMREVLVHVDIENWHSCLSTFCFCVLLLVLNLLFLQWLYYNSVQLSKL